MNTRTTFFILALAIGLPHTAFAQTFMAGVSLSTQTDDETNLGSGPLVSFGVSQPLARRFKWDAEVSVARLHRDSGYLRSTSTPVVATARLAYLFTAPERRVRPFVSFGLAVTHHRGSFVWPDNRHTTWRLTKPGWETGAGIEVQGRGRITLRPELRLGMTQGNADFSPGVDTLEAPVITLRAGLVILW
jgi:hypothetical protein